MMAMTNVIEATAFTIEVTKLGDVYFKLEKYMFSVKLPLHAAPREIKWDVDRVNFLKLKSL